MLHSPSDSSFEEKNCQTVSARPAWVLRLAACQSNVTTQPMDSGCGPELIRSACSSRKRKAPPVSLSVLAIVAQGNCYCYIVHSTPSVLDVLASFQNESVRAATMRQAPARHEACGVGTAGSFLIQVPAYLLPLRPCSAILNRDLELYRSRK